MLGKPTRVAKLEEGEKWFCGLSNLTLREGRVVGWCHFNRKLPVNIGVATPPASPVAVGATAQQVVNNLGTPRTVAALGVYQVWYFEKEAFTLRDGRVVALGCEPPGESTGSGAAVLTPDLDDLLDLYAQNRLAADAKFLDRLVVVTGGVGYVGTSGDQVPGLALRGDNEYSRHALYCFFSPSDVKRLAGIEAQQRIKVKGYCRGLDRVTHESVLTECELVSTAR